MKLDYIHLINFRSHKNSILDLNTFESAVVIGKNGAGKSSFAYGFCFGFWGDVEGLKNADLIRTGATDMEVAIGFVHDDGNKYRVVRGIKVTGIKKKSYSGYLSLLQQSETGDTEDTYGNKYVDVSGNSIPDTTKKISFLLGGLTLKTAIYSNFDLQGETSRFMEAQASDRRKLFEDILNLQQYEELEKKARAQVKKAKSILQSLDIDDTKEAELEQKISAAETSNKDLKKQIEDLQDVIDILMKKKHELDAIVAEGIATLEKKKQPILEDIEKVDSASESISKRLADFAALLSDKENILAKYNDLQDKTVELKDAQEARQAYTVAKGERKSTAGLFSFAETKLKRAQDRLENLSKAIAEEENTLRLKFKLDDNESNLMAWMEKTVESIKAEQEANAASLESEKQDLEAAIKRKTELLNRITVAETTQKTMNAQIKKIETAGAMCPIFNKPCEKLTQEQRDIELAEINEQLAQVNAQFVTLNEEKEVVAASIKNLNTSISAKQDMEKTYARKTLTLSNDIANFVKLQSKTSEESASLNEEILKEKTVVLELEKELDKIDKTIIDTGFNPDQYTLLENTLKTLEAGEWQKRREELMVAEASHGDLEKQLSELVERRQTLTAQIADIATEIESQQKKIFSAKEDLYTVDAAISTNKSKLSAINVELSELSRNMGVFQTLLNQMREQKNKSLEYQKQMQEYSMLEKTYKKARALIVENSVPKFQELCNNILDYLDVNVRIRVETLEEGKDSKTKEIKFTPTFKIIVVDGNRGVERDYNTWSGGEKQRINLALRQALSTILLNRAGTRMDLIIIDESDSALDSEGKDALVKLIQANVEGRFGCSTKVMCITHTDDLKDAFPVRILVKMHKGGKPDIRNSITRDIKMDDNKMRKQIEGLVMAGVQIMRLKDWKVTVDWRMMVEEVGCNMTHEPETKCAIICCNEKMLDTELGIKRLTTGIANRLAELATSGFEREIADEQKRLSALILALLED